MRRVNINLSVQAYATGTVMVSGNIKEEKRGEVTVFTRDDAEFREHEEVEKNMEDAQAFAEEHVKNVFKHLSIE